MIINLGCSETRQDPSKVTDDSSVTPETYVSAWLPLPWCFHSNILKLYSKISQPHKPEISTSAIFPKSLGIFKHAVSKGWVFSPNVVIWLIS
jgi:hypothetical protein